MLGAPLFTDLAANVAEALKGAVVGAYNAAFDMRFLEYELHRSKRGRQAWIPPHVCLMYLRPLLSLGPKCSLVDACAAHGLPPALHRAADDALAGARLWLIYREAAEKAGLQHFEDFEAGGYSFVASFDNDAFTDQLVEALAPPVPPGQLKPRSHDIPTHEAPKKAAAPDRRRQYWHMLVEALSDGVVTPEELRTLRGARHQLALPAEDVRAVHAKLAGEIMASQVEDEAVSASEAAVLTSLFAVLHELGWAPGDQL